jgi:hypothetical protein
MISMNKTYKTKSGLPVRILCINRKATCPVVALVSISDSLERLDCFDECGLSNCGKERLVEVQPWDELKKGDYIFVRDHDTQPWTPRIFQRDNNNWLYCFGGGRNEFTKENQADTVWKYFRLPTKEELAS